DSLPTVTTNASGVWFQGGLRPGSHSVRATDPKTSLATSPITVVVGDGLAQLAPDIALPAYALVSGLVRHAGGAPAGARIEVLAYGTARTATTGAGGAFDFGALPLGTYMFYATAPKIGRAHV